MNPFVRPVIAGAPSVVIEISLKSGSFIFVTNSMNALKIYAKGTDPDNWLNINEDTAEIRLNKIPDRESPFLINGTYFAEILAISKDMPARTATGTIAIKVIDSNDHCPALTSTKMLLCEDQRSILVTAHDEDMDPNGPPFTFKILPENTRGVWEVESVSGTEAEFRTEEKLWPGTYSIEMEVSDAQSLSCPTPQTFDVNVCECVGPDASPCMAKQASSEEKTHIDFSGPAVSLMIVAACLLLFIPFLMVVCQCGGTNAIFADKFRELPFEAKEHLIAYHTEGRGEDKEVPLYSAPLKLGTQRQVEGATTLLGGMTKETREIITTTNTSDAFMVNGGSSRVMGQGEGSYSIYRDRYLQDQGFSTYNGRTVYDKQATMFEDIALPDAFLEQYYSQKSAVTVTGKDALLVYDDEGFEAQKNFHIVEMG
uniref:Cadherin domain-containing protein n=1 Tax=Knipowitschia caucasica TaxID=637954 RepID=A0AAV2KYG2_KNICA